MTLACLTYVIVIFCGPDANYVHFLEAGEQFLTKSSYYTVVSATDISNTKLRYPNSKNLTLREGKCGCPVPTNVLKEKLEQEGAGE